MIPRRVVLILLLAILCLDCGKSGPPLPLFVEPGSSDTTLTFISFNLAVGFDLSGLLAADLTDSATIIRQVKSLYGQATASRPRERMQRIADSIVAISPTVVGLQEALYLVDETEQDTIDFLAELKGRIEEQSGIQYQYVSHTMNRLHFDLRVTNDTLDDSLNTRFHEGNTIMLHPDLQVLAADSLVYHSTIQDIPLFDTTWAVERGAGWVRAQMPDGVRINLFNTHLEVIPTLSLLQCTELLTFLQNAEGFDEALVLMGDFNSTPGGPVVDALLKERFADTHAQGTAAPAATCCFELDAETDTAQNRIDFIFAKRIVAVEKARTGIVGHFEMNGTHQLSDHAAVIAHLTLH